MKKNKLSGFEIFAILFFVFDIVFGIYISITYSTPVGYYLSISGVIFAILTYYVKRSLEKETERKIQTITKMPVGEYVNIVKNKLPEVYDYYIEHYDEVKDMEILEFIDSIKDILDKRI